jgi:hypothetical protein
MKIFHFAHFIKGLENKQGEKQMSLIRKILGLPEKSDLVKFHEYEKDNIFFVRQLEDFKSKFINNELYYGVHIKMLVDRIIAENK